jgi:hypothetical protein
MTVSSVLDSAGRRRSPATLPGFHAGRAPRHSRRAARTRQGAGVALIAGRRSLAGSAIGGLPDTQEMLDFCAEHGVRPAIELIAAEGS